MISIPRVKKPAALRVHGNAGARLLSSVFSFESQPFSDSPPYGQRNAVQENCESKVPQSGNGAGGSVPARNT